MRLVSAQRNTGKKNVLINRKTLTQDNLFGDAINHGACSTRAPFLARLEQSSPIAGHKRQAHVGAAYLARGCSGGFGGSSTAAPGVLPRETAPARQKSGSGKFRSGSNRMLLRRHPCAFPCPTTGGAWSGDQNQSGFERNRRLQCPGPRFWVRLQTDGPQVIWLCQGSGHACGPPGARPFPGRPPPEKRCRMRGQRCQTVNTSVRCRNGESGFNERACSMPTRLHSPSGVHAGRRPDRIMAAWR
ncbi:hypothetical protein J2850_001574 [Azospirillum picis]|uniref:Uncharacterized protein n=1 Tax=Azospirillum picis TaxID=488438 RepID=A0ABU0MHF1_9PROT|nr:hypothetical protein [Azospirillum picis]MDQ0532870.1 hypothetical protein [Azospirillum picis]